MKRSLFCLVICLVLFCTSCAGTGKVTASIKANPLPTGTEIKQSTTDREMTAPAYDSLADFELVAEKNGSQLYLLYNQLQLIIAYKQSPDSEPIFSSPADYASGEKVNINAGAQMIVEYNDESSNVRTANSLTGSVRTKSAKVLKINDGLLIKYDFKKPKEDFEIPVKFVLTDEGLEASIIYDNVVERGLAQILKITFLPYMNSALNSDEGYMFIPDGCGAIVPFKGKSSDDTNYASSVYGRDPILSVSMLSNFSQNIYLPVFGVEKSNSSVLAIIKSGEALATLNAYQIKGDSRYANIYPVFIYRTRDEVKLSDAWNGQSFKQSAVLPSQIHEATVLYKCLAKGSGYNGMATEYGKYLKKLGVGTEVKADASLYIDVLGSVKKTKSVMGFPKKVTEPFTTFKQTEEILEYLSKSNVDSLNVRVLGGMNGGMDDAAVTSPTYESKLGGKSGWEKLMKKAESLNAGLYMNAEFVNIHKSRSGWPTYKIGAQNVYRMAAEIGNFELSTTLPKKDATAHSYYLMAPEYIKKEVNEFLKNYSVSKNGMFSYGSLGNTVYSDFANKRFTDRSSTQDVITEALGKLTKDGKTLLDGGNSYALPYASAIIAAPMYDTGYAFSKYDVPFYQISLHGLVEYTCPASNLDTEPDKILKMLETGSLPYFIVSNDEVFDLEGTFENWIYSGTWKNVKDSIVDEFETVSKAFKGINNLPITSHRVVDDNVRITVYGDKTAIIVNYGDSEAQIAGQSVAGHGYITVNADSVREENV